MTDLLKRELDFKGLIVTDALNIMKAVAVLANAPLLASKAGNDMLLMPIDEVKTIESILDEMGNDPAYKQRVLSISEGGRSLQNLFGAYYTEEQLWLT